MTKDITAGVVLSLKDNFSGGMGKAAGASAAFSNETVGALNKVNGALSGTAAKLGAFGVTLSVGAAAKEIIDFDAKMTDLGISADMSSEEVAKLKQEIFDVAAKSTIKLDVNSIYDAQNVVLGLSGDAEFARANIENMAIAMRATGSSGSDIGALFAEFQKASLSAEEVAEAMETLTVQGKSGGFSTSDFARNGARLMNAYAAAGRTGVEATKELGAAMQSIFRGVGSADMSTTAFERLVSSLTDVDVREKLQKALNIDTLDSEGKLRSITDLIAEIVEGSKGNTGILGEIFDVNAMRAFNDAISEYNKTGLVRGIKDFREMTSDGNVLMNDAARAASTLNANLNNLQTAFLHFADSNLAKPLEVITSVLNKMAEDPKRIEAVFDVVKRGVLAIAAIKLSTGVVSFMSKLQEWKGGGASAKIVEELSLGAGTGSANGMPVYVTNWSGGVGAGAGAMPVTGGGLLDQYGNPMRSATPVSKPAAPAPIPATKKLFPNFGKIDKSLKALGAAAVFVDAARNIYGTVKDINEIKQNTEMTESDKRQAISETKGKAIGETAGSAAGMIVGGLVGSIAGPAGTMIGATIGSAIGGWLGEHGGSFLGKWKAKNEESLPEQYKKNDEKSGGHYEYKGVNGVPVWVPAKTDTEKLYIPGGMTKPQQQYLPPQAAQQVNVPEKVYIPGGMLKLPETLSAKPEKQEVDVNTKVDVYVHEDGPAEVKVQQQSTKNISGTGSRYSLGNVKEARLAQ
jgi:phage tail tape-measure protein